MSRMQYKARCVKYAYSVPFVNRNWIKPGAIPKAFLSIQPDLPKRPAEMLYDPYDPELLTAYSPATTPTMIIISWVSPNSRPDLHGYL